MLKLFQSLLSKIEELNLFKSVYVFNDHIDRLRLGYVKYLTPACFVEIEQRKVINLGNKLIGMDLNIKFHIVTFQINEFGEYDETFDPYYVRDIMYNKFYSDGLYNCSEVNYVADIREWKHDNIYHYVMTLKTHYIDNVAYEDPYYNDWQLLDWNESEDVWDDTEFEWDKMKLLDNKIQITI